MKRCLLLLFVGLLACGVSCRKNDWRTMLVHVPEMKNQACVDYIRGVLAKESGVKLDVTRFDVEKRTIEVTYQSLLLSMKNVEFYISEAGFSANGVPARPAAVATLPPGCR